MGAVTGPAGRLRRVNGPLVECTGIGSPAVAELVALGERGVWGEVVAVADGRVTVQAYEDTGGLAPGDPARALRRPLSARLGPGLLGQVFDGLLRPLSSAPMFLDGSGQSAEDAAGSWRFEGRVRAGEQVAEGAVLGVLRTDGPLEHRVLVPPGVSGAVDTVAADGTCSADATIASVAGTPIRVARVLACPPTTSVGRPPRHRRATAHRATRARPDVPGGAGRQRRRARGIRHR